jgi:hypothetical protein
MSYLPIILKGAGVFAIVMGTLNTIIPTRMISNTSKDVYSPQTPAQILADSHLRYWAGVWASTGAIFWWASNDLAARRVPVDLVGLGYVFGGVGRVISGMKYGYKPEGLVKTITAIEIVAPIAIWYLLP